MKRRAVLLVAIWLGSAIWTAPRAQGPERTPDATPASGAAEFRTVLNRYCTSCHNQRAMTANLALDTLDVKKISEHADVWEKVVRKLRAGAMPPPGAGRPDQTTSDGLRAWLEAELDREAAAHPRPGRPALHRLNRAEYANAIHDLLALDVDVASLLPPDDSAYGFDNIADVLGVSPVLLERYLSAAEKVSAIAVGERDGIAGSETYRLRQDLSQDKHVEGLPLGTVGGGLFHHTFPLDGEYVLQARLFRNHTDGTRGLEHPHQLEITIDGTRVFLGAIGGDADFRALYADSTPASDAIDARLKVRVPVTAGSHAVGVTFIQKSLAANSRKLQPYVRSSFDTYDYTGRPHISTLTITGPFNPTGSGDTHSRRRIFSCRPANEAAEEACAARIISALGTRAYRQPLAAADQERLLRFYRDGRREGTFETGIQMVLQRILSSPKFIVRAEHDPADAEPGTIYRIADVELASRLSFFLWSSIPDEELLTAAAHGRLKVPAVLEAQVRRMLADPRAGRLVTNFAGQWLQLRNLQKAAPNSEQFPDFDDNLRQAFRRETELLFASVMNEDRNVLDLMTADYTFVNERLARHYRIPNVSGSQFRRIAVTDEARKGLLGHGSILTLTSNPTRTSPVLRGKWVLDNLIGAPPPPAPPDVPPLKEDGEGEKPKTAREQMAEHRADPVCASCHKLMDPIGLAMENFDAVGVWRTRDAATAIDASGELFDGTKVDGVVTLRQALLKHPDVFAGTVTEKLLTYALGRGLDHQDMPAVRAIVRDAAGHDYRFSSLVLGVVNSVPFQMRSAASSELPASSSVVSTGSSKRE